AVNGGRASVQEALTDSRAAAEARRTSPLIHRHAVRQRVVGVRPADERRSSPHAARRAKQVQLPAFPTTTIGSLPQTPPGRAARAAAGPPPLSHPPAGRQGVGGVPPADERRSSPHAARRAKQVQLPAFPTTTIGSFPQTAEVRGARKKLHDGTWTAAQYEAF